VPPKFDRERMRRHAQKVEAMDSRQRAEHKMREMARAQGRVALEKHIRKKVMEITPGVWRALSEWLPPKVWFAFWGKMTWIVLQPGRFVRWLLYISFIRPAAWLQRRVWQGGTWTEVEVVDDRIVIVTIHRGMTARYKCRFNLFTQAIDNEEVG